MRHSWRKGVDFMDKFDRKYRTTIGALESLPDGDETTFTCVCDAPHWITPIVTPMSSYMTDCSQIEAQYINDPGVSCDLIMGGGHPTYRWHHKDSDGVVLAESQMDIPQATYGNPEILLLRNSTHMRARNDLNTEIMLKRVLQGDVGLFFRTEEK